MIGGFEAIYDSSRETCDLCVNVLSLRQFFIENLAKFRKFDDGIDFHIFRWLIAIENDSLRCFSDAGLLWPAKDETGMSDLQSIEMNE